MKMYMHALKLACSLLVEIKLACSLLVEIKPSREFGYKFKCHAVIGISSNFVWYVCKYHGFIDYVWYVCKYRQVYRLFFYGFESPVLNFSAGSLYSKHVLRYLSPESCTFVHCILCRLV